MEVVPREVCLRCHRPRRLCYCSRLPALRTRTHIVLLQHPREARMPVGTARMAHLALPGSELHKGVFFHDHARVNALLDEPGTMLLFPGDGAIDPRTLAPGQVRNLIVIDGTWWQARKVLKQNPMLLRLPRLGLDPERPSNYRIRREPSADCLATIEAVSGVLGVLEGEPEKFEAMLAAFTFMVDQQIAHTVARVGPPRRRKPRIRDLTEEERLLAATNVVLVHAEVNAHSRKVAIPGRPELLHLVAHRGAGETFEAVLAPRRPLAPSAAHHLGVAAERILSGESVESARLRWRAFARPDDLIAGWGTYPAHLCRTEGLAVPAYIDLRAVVARRIQGRPGSPAEAIAALGGSAPGSLASGRAGQTVAAMARIVEALRARPRRGIRAEAKTAA